MKIILKIIVLVCLYSVIASAISSSSVGNIGASGIKEYTVTIKKLEIYNSTTAKWIVLSNTSTNIDIASASAGAAIGALISNDAAMTYGTYTKVKVKIGNTFTIKACTTAPNASCTNNSITNSGAAVSSGVLTSGTQQLATSMTGTNAAAATPITMTIDFTDSANITLPAGATVVGTDLEVEQSLPAPYKASESAAAPNIDVSFDVNNIFTAKTMGANLDGNGGNDNYIIINFPSVNISLR